MNLITLENISKSYSEKPLLNNVSLGINGAGKSTLLKIVTGKEEFFDGSVTKGKNVRIEFLSQSQDFQDDATVLEQIFKGDSKEMKLLRDYEETLESLNSSPSNFDELNERLIKLQGEIDGLNLWELESEAKSILNKLGITST
ncbi:MAG: ATP-binding cassette domain-containing protein, partial [Clostridium sp.]|nr:ATP-binding cassette domain-containing protein [Clostridium sp.]